MNVALRNRPMTLEEFLAWEDRQERPHEFDGRRIVEVVAVTHTHARILRNLLLWAGTSLDANEWEMFGPETRLRLAQKVRYPDAMIVRAGASGTDRDVTEPVAVFEILSESTMHIDFGEKNEEYRDAASVVRYVLVHTDGVRVTMFRRDGAAWVGSLLGAADVVEMPEIGAALPIAALYHRIEFAARSEGDQSRPDAS